LRNSKLFALVLVPALFVGLLGCTGTPPPTKSMSMPHTLNIDSKCEVHPEWQPVHLTDTVTWQPPDTTHSYSVQFHGYDPFGPTTAPIPVPPSKPLTVNGGSQCPDPGGTSAATACYFPYDIAKDGHKCGDPGIHVTQTGGTVVTTSPH